ncbi:MAG TPA: putative lipid II flippase FtsW [Quisquiliibacterium sp.]|nr:putative lipid II flippase FtsW [Quisquiliibacterium sp.]HPA90753.1 putative lipid II flippase FtsW [Quisquiliibacterium sp.]HQD84027.1 putative lipid II flippase FtsW [Quisquiliibacterium sp.]HQN12273.1 putative lipid II flippase FtsW [Quisquiliibacterium sp.]HQP65482.1 putative lipid II flippase FtsW [Quisquiliibacterium sp.]
MLSLRLPWRAAGRGGTRASSAPVVRNIDVALVWTIALLLLFGLVMVYSASIALPDSPRFANYKPTHFLVRHAFSIALGVSLGLVAFAVPVRVWQTWAPLLFLVGLVLLVLVLIPGVGKVVYGARRWLSLAVINVQPSELMKLFVVLYAADYTVRKQDYMQQFSKGFLPMGTAVAAVGLLLLLEPDLGAFVVIAAVAMGVLFLGGVNGKLFAGLVVTALSTFALLIMLSPWRRERIFAYLDPFADPLGKGYQLTHSLIAFGRGELFGVGLGGSIEKLHYLPEAHTDFLLAVIGEELGLVGVMVVIVAFYWITRRAFEIGRQAIALDRVFAGLTAKGVALWIGFQAFINMGVNVGLLPTKGLTLPLMSYGGTGILVNCVALAVLLRVDYENRKLMRGLA